MSAKILRESDFDELTFEIQGCVRCGKYAAAAKIARKLAKALDAAEADTQKRIAEENS